MTRNTKRFGYTNTRHSTIHTGNAVHVLDMGCPTPRKQQSDRTKRSTEPADSVVTYINIKHGGSVTADVIRLRQLQMGTSMERFAPLQKALTDEMTELLQKISDEPDNFGFALAVPNDYGAACIFYAIGKDSALGPHGKLSESFIFTPVQWVQDWTDMPRVNDALDDIVERFRETYSAMEDGAEKNRMHDEFISECANCCLGVLEECNRSGLFGNIWFKVLEMSDDEHPVVVESFRRLNSEQVQERGAAFFDY